MAKLVLLSAGMAGQIHELKVDKTTVGRVEDNMLQVPEPSVSSHHCEILLRGGQVFVNDLNSTNGTYINGEKIARETPLKPGEVLRLGQIEMRLENGASPAAPPGPAAAAPASSRNVSGHTVAIPRGVSLNELEQGARGGGIDSKGFAKKEDKVNRVFVFAGVAIGVIILVLLLYVFAIAGK